MIISFRHKGLKAFFETESRRGIHPGHAEKLRERLTVLNVIKRVSDVPGNLAVAWNLHPLHGKLEGHYGLSVGGNWRITFTLKEEDVALVDYQDYH
ncbi:MAG TPA: type II toxin-antitoxin system RelE/ParE family toxin [Pseudacidobacterium sp.]|nr:type II toxin-antitoxin system RelE/ParE family toxin [Pseudacidobacterium sp.]